ncbi:uncharacterized protein AB675_2000 [Cyphellophora attinorum]|uniref:Uncharacterized protein n=1 Tax=Cyphellophora attinorum TaxID=1664694 RepID=A0A0N1HDX8_9EURO|nr:uncharacterized protein AB675_2000 [Phialophora attinorum]KPI43010.1 hypothetical protein AB675_2000 [Phialophora attinorum]
MSTIKTLAVRTARVTISPPPSSVLHTTAILEKLSTGREVVSFTKENVTASRAQYELRYTPHENASIEEGDSDIEYIPPRPDPENLDFYNVFGYRDRYYPDKKSFRCNISKVDGNDLERGKHGPSRLKRHPATEALYEDLYWSNVPAILRKGLSWRPSTPQHDAATDAVRPALEVRQPLRLMELYRAHARQEVPITGPTSAEPSLKDTQSTVVDTTRAHPDVGQEEALGPKRRKSRRRTQRTDDVLPDWFAERAVKGRHERQADEKKIGD